MNQLYPRVLAEERDALSVRTTHERESVRALMGETEKLLKKHPDEAREKAREAASILGRLRGDISAVEEKERAFDKARATHQQELAQAEKTIEQARAHLAVLLEERYHADPEKELGDACAEMIRASDILKRDSDVPDYGVVVTHAKRAREQATAVRDHWQKRIELHKENQEAVKELKKWQETVFPKFRVDYTSSLGSLKEKTPEEVWRPVAQQMEQAEQAFEANAETFLKDIERMNGMEMQNFEDAARRLEELKRFKNDVETAYNRPKKTLQSQEEAEEKAKALLGVAASKIQRAERVVREADSEGSGKNDLNTARGKLSEAERLKGSALPNWITVVALVAGSIVLAESAERSAKSHAHEVATRRRRQHEDEERRRRDDSYSSHSSSSSGGFSGFGGGSFGGGGASGGW